MLQFSNMLQVTANRAADVAAALPWMFRDAEIHTSKQGRGHNLKPVSGVLAVASRGSSITVRLVRVLIGVLVVLLHQRRVVPAVLRARGQTVAVLPRSFVVIVLIGRHQAVAFNRRVVCCGVVAVSVSLGLLRHEEQNNKQTLKAYCSSDL